MIKLGEGIVVHFDGRSVLEELFGSFVTFHVVFMFTDLFNPGTYTRSALATYKSQ